MEQLYYNPSQLIKKWYQSLHYKYPLKATKQKCYTIVTTNMYKKNLICNNIKYIINQTMFTSKSQYLTF
jgi:hypothetical protein